jgi:hypothetical protein
VAQECKPFHVSRNLASLRNWGTVSDGGLAVFLFSDCVDLRLQEFQSLFLSRLKTSKIP